MIALYLLACHLVGDFVLQTRWQAASKLDDRRARLDHCATYTAPFVVLALVVGHGPLAWYGFPLAIFAGHYLTDSCRYHSTLGDWLAWRSKGLGVGGDSRALDWLNHLDATDPTGSPHPVSALPAGFRQRVPPNPWTSLPLMIDQALHVCQIALLAGLLL